MSNMIGARVGSIPAVSIYMGDTYSSGKRYPQFNGNVLLSGDRSCLDAVLPEYHPTTEFTVSGWVNPSSYEASFGDQNQYGFTIFSSDPTASNDRYPLWVRIWNGNLIVRVFQSGTENTTQVTAPIPLNTWSHIGISADRAGMVNVYLNSSLIGSFEPVNDSGVFTESFIIGDLRRNRNICFKGHIKRVGLWNDAKSHEFMQGLAYAGNIDTQDESLVAFWKLENDFTDSSPSQVSLFTQGAELIS